MKILLLIAFALQGCSVETSYKKPPVVGDEPVRLKLGVYRFHDKERDVYCYGSSESLVCDFNNGKWEIYGR